MIGRENTERLPSHACPRCGEWFDVENDGHETWVVSPYDSEDDLSATVWTEAARDPLCPFDSTTLDDFKIQVT